MDSIIYNALMAYYNALEKLGHVSDGEVAKLLVLTFYNELIFRDFRNFLSREDYHIVEQALDCLYGSTCLIPYPEYLNMGNLHIGDISELANRVQALEDTNVLKVIHEGDYDPRVTDSDIVFVPADE